MNHLKVYELTEMYRILGSIKKPDARIKAAKKTVLEAIVRTAEGVQELSWATHPIEGSLNWATHPIEGSET
jgi:hypothetical protein